MHKVRQMNAIYSYTMTCRTIQKHKIYKVIQCQHDYTVNSNIKWYLPCMLEIVQIEHARVQVGISTTLCRE